MSDKQSDAKRDDKDEPEKKKRPVKHEHGKIFNQRGIEKKG